MDERKLFADSQEIQKMYQKAGYQKTVVKYRTEIDENAGRGKVTFEIAETPKVKIERRRLRRRGGLSAKETAQGHQDAAALDVFLADRQRRVEGRTV